MPENSGIHIGADRRVDPSTVSGDVLAAREMFDELYRSSPSIFFQRLSEYQHRESQHNQPYLLIREEDDSDTHVLLTQPPFGTNTLIRPGNPNSYNTAVKNSLLNFVLRYRGMTDPEGRPLSTLVLGRDDRDYSMRFSPAEYAAVYRGDFTPYAKRVLDVAGRLGYEAAYYYCYSASTATGGAALRAAGVKTLDIEGFVAAEPVNFFKQPVRRFITKYVGNYAKGRRPAEVSGHWWNDGLQVMLDLQAEYGDGSYLGNFIRFGTLPAVRGMAQANLSGNLKGYLSQGKPAVLAYGERSGLANQVKEIVVEDDELSAFAKAGLLDVVRINGPGTGHDWGEDHLAFAAVMSDGLLKVSGQSS